MTAQIASQQIFVFIEKCKLVTTMRGKKKKKEREREKQGTHDAPSRQNIN